MIEDALRTNDPELVLPTAREVLVDNEVGFHFFVDSAEGVSLAFDAARVIGRLDEAERRVREDRDEEPRPRVSRTRNS